MIVIIAKIFPTLDPLFLFNWNAQQETDIVYN